MSPLFSGRLNNQSECEYVCECECVCAQFMGQLRHNDALLRDVFWSLAFEHVYPKKYVPLRVTQRYYTQKAPFLLGVKTLVYFKSFKSFLFL